MKKQLILISFLWAAVNVFANSDAAQLNSEMISAYNGGFYPGVVRCADKILQENASSPFAGAAFIYKGESLFRMGRVEEAVLVLDKARKATGDDEELSAQRLYWLGRCFETGKGQGSPDLPPRSGKTFKKRKCKKRFNLPPGTLLFRTYPQQAG